MNIVAKNEQYTVLKGEINMSRNKLFAIIFLAVVIGCSACVSGDDGSTNEKPQHTNKYSEEEIISIIDTNIDILASKIDFDTDEHDIMAAYPAETYAILTLGESALPHLKDIASKFHSYREDLDSYRAIMAMALSYKIKPELYELKFESPNGKYALMASVKSFTDMFVPFEWGSYCNVRIVDTESGATVITADDDYADYYANIEVNWSDDSHYAAMSEGHQRYGTRMTLFDLKKNEFVVLPYLEIKDEVLPEGSYYSYHLKFKSLDANSKRITVYFTILINNAAETSVEGEYIYDIGEKKIINLTITNE